MSYLEKIMLVCGHEPAVYRELKLEPLQADEGETHYYAQVDQHVSVLLTQTTDGKVTCMAIRTADPVVVQQLQVAIAAKHDEENQHD